MLRDSLLLAAAAGVARRRARAAGVLGGAGFPLVSRRCPGLDGRGVGDAGPARRTGTENGHRLAAGRHRLALAGAGALSRTFAVAALVGRCHPLFPLRRGGVVAGSAADARRVERCRPRGRRYADSGIAPRRLAVALHRVRRAALAVAVLSLGELSAGKLVATPGMPSYATDIFTQMHYGVTNELAARCVLLLILVAAGGVGVALIGRRRG